jgi:hypothetical protein
VQVAAVMLCDPVVPLLVSKPQQDRGVRGQRTACIGPEFRGNGAYRHPAGVPIICFADGVCFLCTFAISMPANQRNA